jgi:hypothetical protein
VQVTATVIDFHLVEKCRTKFRAFVKSYGAHVKFEPVLSQLGKQEYRGTVTVSRACKQQYLTRKQAARSVKAEGAAAAASAASGMECTLQCAAPEPVTTGALHCLQNL